MKKIQLLAVAMTLSVSGWAHAEASQRVEGPKAERGDVANGAALDLYADTASFSSNSRVPRALDFNFTKFDVPFYVESGRVSHVPEPEGWAMMLMGAGFVVYQVRRRKRVRESWDLR